MNIKQIVLAILIIIIVGAGITGAAYALSNSRFITQQFAGMERGEYGDQAWDFDDYHERWEYSKGRGGHGHRHGGFISGHGLVHWLFNIGLIALIMAGIFYAPKLFRRGRAMVSGNQATAAGPPVEGTRETDEATAEVTDDLAEDKPSIAMKADEAAIDDSEKPAESKG